MGDILYPHDYKEFFRKFSKLDLNIPLTHPSYHVATSFLSYGALMPKKHIDTLRKHPAYHPKSTYENAVNHLTDIIVETGHTLLLSGTWDMPIRGFVIIRPSSRMSEEESMAKSEGDHYFALTTVESTELSASGLLVAAEFEDKDETAEQEKLGLTGTHVTTAHYQFRFSEAHQGKIRRNIEEKEKEEFPAKKQPITPHQFDDLDQLLRQFEYFGYVPIADVGRIKQEKMLYSKQLSEQSFQCIRGESPTYARCPQVIQFDNQAQTALKSCIAKESNAADAKIESPVLASYPSTTAALIANDLGDKKADAPSSVAGAAKKTKDTPEETRNKYLMKVFNGTVSVLKRDMQKWRNKIIADGKTVNPSTTLNPYQPPNKRIFPSHTQTVLLLNLTEQTPTAMTSRALVEDYRWREFYGNSADIAKLLGRTEEQLLQYMWQLEQEDIALCNQANEMNKKDINECRLPDLSDFKEVQKAPTQSGHLSKYRTKKITLVSDRGQFGNTLVSANPATAPVTVLTPVKRS